MIAYNVTKTNPAQTFNTIQEDRLAYGEGPVPDLEASDVTFKFGGSGSGTSRFKSTFRTDEGVCAGKDMEFQVCNITGDETLGLVCDSLVKAEPSGCGL